MVHRLVADAFIPNPDNLNEIDHIDTNPLNNHVDNLRWCTHSENVNNELTRIKNSKAKKGKFNTKKSVPIVQLKDGKIIQIYSSISEAVRQGFCHSVICRCCQGERFQHKGYEWMYLSDYENITKEDL